MLWGLTVVFPQDLSGKESEQGSERCTERKPSRIIQIIIKLTCFKTDL